jgi:AraC-like DNA-binding protein
VPSQPSDDTLDRQQIGTLLRTPWQYANLEVNRALHAAGHGTIQPAHQLVFQHLPDEGAHLAQLAQLAQASESALRELVDDLTSNGYLSSAADGRIRRAPRGWEVEHIARDTFQRLEDEWGERMGLERYAELCALLAYLGNIIDPDADTSRTRR